MTPGAEREDAAMNGPVRTALAGCLLLGALLVGAPAGASVAHARVVSENPADFTPNVMDGGGVDHTSVDALAQLGSTLYAGGNFRLVQSAGTTFNRSHLMSFNATTGAMSSFAPTLDGKVFALLAQPGALYVGGFFSNVNGVARRGLVKLDPGTGAVDTAFNARLRGAVQEIRLVNGRLLVGGRFPEKLLALDPTTGANTGYINVPISGTVASNAGPTDIYRFAVSPQGTKLVALGNFTSVGGSPRSRAFMLDLGPTSATLSPWYYPPLTNACRSTRLPAYLRDVDFSPDGSYFAFVSTGFVPFAGGIGRDLCDAAARFETNVVNPVRPTWINYSGGDTFHSVAATGVAVYVQGHFRALDNPNGTNGPLPGSSPRQGIGAIDPVGGRALPWNPGKTRGVGGKDFLATAAGLWVASDGRLFNGEVRDNLAFLPL
jgi:hypothetical protein